MRKNYCMACGKILTRNEAGLNRKLIDGNMSEYYCLACLAEYLDVPEDALLAKIEDFKQEGCKLFS